MKSDSEKESAKLALIVEAGRLLAAASEEELRGAAGLWELHRTFLGGVSSVTGAMLPTWEECAPVPKAAHLVIWRHLRGQSSSR